MSSPPNVTTTKHFPIVGIGASAGGLAAFEAFFSGFPPGSKPGMAFVVVQHLSPDHKSLLAELIGRYTDFQVFEVVDGVVIRPNCVYVNPPNHDLALFDGALQLMPVTLPRGQRLPIDYFFRSLAQDQHQYAIAVILSGMGADGSQGLISIKEHGGIVVVQSPASTQFDVMPRSAIATDLVDFVLSPSEMPAQLTKFAEQAFGNQAGMLIAGDAQASIAMQKVFTLLRTRTGHDFSNYKSSTVERRIARRMAVHQSQSVSEYATFLQRSQEEVDSLFRDMLIGVTNFFRDPEAFQVLEGCLAEKLSIEKLSGTFRAWVCGCSTGEEAYSIAMVLQEQLAASRSEMSAQVFATDIDARSIAKARAGYFPKHIEEDISPARIASYFHFDPVRGDYRIQRTIRDLLVFSEHDVNRDPPFSKLDLICCRNLMIYLNLELQRLLIPSYHFALKPGGLLFLGTSEGIGDFDDLFETVDRKAKVFRRKPNQPGLSYSPNYRSLSTRILLSEQRLADPTQKNPIVQEVKAPLRQLVEQTLLEHLAPAAALVTANGDIAYLLGRTGLFLEPAAGEAGTNNILKMARQGLRHELTSALKEVESNKLTVRVNGVRVKTNGHYAMVNLSVCPAVPNKVLSVDSKQSQMYLVVLEEATTGSNTLNSADNANNTSPHIGESVNSEIIALREELRAKEEYLQSAREELESSNEELKSSSEEMQSVNEELQSTNEELETSKEELQSINEELSTVNSELQSKVLDLSRLNNDMNNLLAGSGVATVFIDRVMRILRFTPSIAQIINLIPSDIGRPVAHIVSNLVSYDRLVADAQVVLDTLVTTEKQVQTSNGLWFTMRLQPYRTLDDFIEGVVITFVDITETKRIEAALEAANSQLRLAVVVRDASDAVTVYDLSGRIIAWNPSAVRIYGWTEQEALGMNVSDRIPEPLRKGCLAMTAELSQAEVLAPYKTERLTKDGSVLTVWVTATALINESGCVYAIATTERAEGLIG